MTNNLISVVLPTYNSQIYLNRALDSVKNQNYKKFELIVIDNSSTDNTEKIINSYKNSININLFKIKNNGIISKSRNKGIIESKGNIICFLDSDDYWNESKLYRINQLFNENFFDICCHNELGIDINGHKFKKYFHGFKSKNFYNDLLILGNCLSTSAVSIRKEFIINNNFYFSENINFITAEDYDFWLNFAKFDAKFLFINEFLGFYQFLEKSSSNKNIEIHLRNVNNVIENHLNNLSNKNIINLTRARLQFTNIKLMFKRKKNIDALLSIYNLKFYDFFYISKFIFIKLIKLITK